MSSNIVIQTLLLILTVNHTNCIFCSLLGFAPVVKFVERVTQFIGLDGDL